MGNIVLLDDLTINKIAAGEVIERPASVVKELVENSIDAGATRVNVEVRNGGISKIKIVDNGSGISSDDMELSFERHATSKIRKADDLSTVKSMGFRGEALASIAAISKVEMISKTANDEIGHKLTIEGGDIIEKEEIGSQVGTTITVNNLFYNTPVRYKFLKKDFTELGYIEDVITRIALANPNVAVKLSNENKTIIQTVGDGDIKNVIYSIYGKDIVDGLIETEYEYEGIEVKGVVGKPEIARNNRTHQIFFVNKRYIKNKTLSAGVEQAFKGLIPIGKFGFIILNIEINPEKIDVNVHPTKLEIRFQEEQKVFKAVYHTIREALINGDLVKEANKEKEETSKEEILISKENLDNEKIDKNELMEATEKAKPQIPSFINLFKKKENVKAEEPHIIENDKENVKAEEPHIIENDKENTIMNIYNEKNFIKEKTNEYTTPTEKQLDETMQKLENLNSLRLEEKDSSFDEMYVKTFGKLPKAEEKKQKTMEQETINLENVSIFKDQEIPEYKFIGVIFSTYIIIELKNEIYIIDQHAAHERVLYEKIKKNFYSDTEKESQIMLLPDIINLSHKEKDIVKENIGMFKRAGFLIEEFGDNTIRLIGVPAICEQMDTKELFLEILDAVGSVAITAHQEKEDKFISTVACKAAVKANMKLSREEVDNLLKQLLVLPNPFTCPHGRPTTIKMSKYEIERKFNRK